MLPQHLKIVGIIYVYRDAKVLCFYFYLSVVTDEEWDQRGGGGGLFKTSYKNGYLTPMLV